MGKFKGGFVTKAREDLRQEEEQKRLHEKHEDIDHNTLIIEKDNMAKFTVRTVGNIIRLIATIMVLILAALGLLTLLYPEVREELMRVLISIYNQVRIMVGM